MAKPLSEAYDDLAREVAAMGKLLREVYEPPLLRMARWLAVRAGGAESASPADKPDTPGGDSDAD